MDTLDDRKPQEAMVRPLQEGELTDAPDQAHLSQLPAEGDQSLRCVDLAGKNTYQLVSIISHYGSTTHSGHYVSEVYNVGRSRWFHYDDRQVTCVEDTNVLGEGPQRNAYIFFYLRRDLCSVQPAG